MEISAFTDKSHIPLDSELPSVLGEAAPRWLLLKSKVEDAFGPITEEWTHSGAKYGWSLRLKQKKRAILYMTPLQGKFRVGLALGEKAVALAFEQDLPADIRQIVEEAPKYAEGRGVRIMVTTDEELDAILTLAKAKMAT